MHRGSRQETAFALNQSHTAFPGHAYSGRGYSSASSSPSEYWTYETASSTYPVQNATLPRGYYKQSRHWSNEYAHVRDSSSFPRSIDSYDTSLRSTDHRRQSNYGSSTNHWPSSQPSPVSPQWSEFHSDSSIQSWGNMMHPHGEEIEPIVDQHTVSPSLSTISSPSPSPSPVLALAASNPHSDYISSTNGSEIKICSHCHVTSTPLWRRDPYTLRTLCNACGLYLQQRNKLRPQELIDADLDDDSDEFEQEGTGPECSHCHTRKTSVWRRSKTGAQLCNACGVYVRLRGKDRPLSLRRNKIKPRTKHAKPSLEKY